MNKPFAILLTTAALLLTTRQASALPELSDNADPETGECLQNDVFTLEETGNPMVVRLTRDVDVTCTTPHSDQISHLCLRVEERTEFFVPHYTDGRQDGYVLGAESKHYVRLAPAVISTCGYLKNYEQDVQTTFYYGQQFRSFGAIRVYSGSASMHTVTDVYDSCNSRENPQAIPMSDEWEFNPLDFRTVYDESADYDERLPFSPGLPATHYGEWWHPTYPDRRHDTGKRSFIENRPNECTPYRRHWPRRYPDPAIVPFEPPKLPTTNVPIE